MRISDWSSDVCSSYLQSDWSTPMRFMVVIFSFFCTACVTTSGSGVVRPEYKEYSVSHALSAFESKKISDGQLIYISGYLTFGDDKNNLWGNEEGYKKIREKKQQIKTKSE